MNSPKFLSVLGLIGKALKELPGGLFNSFVLEIITGGEAVRYAREEERKVLCPSSRWFGKD